MNLKLGSKAMTQRLDFILGKQKEMEGNQIQWAGEVGSYSSVVAGGNSRVSSALWVDDFFMVESLGSQEIANG